MSRDRPGPLRGIIVQDISGRVELVERHWFSSGGSADIWRGKWRDGRSSQWLAVKIVRTYTRCDDEDFITRNRKKLLREAQVLSYLSHPNITPFYGVCFDLGRNGTPSFVSPYYDHGDLASYLTKNKGADKIKLISQAAGGLAYLHSLETPVVHGDIKCLNILVNHKREACICDFGQSRILGMSGFTTKVTTGTYRWMASELFGADVEDQPVATLASDVWAFAMTVLEVFSGKVPYYYIRNDIRVLMAVVAGVRPHLEKYDQVPAEIWSVLERCWDTDAAQRPLMRWLALFFDVMCAVRPKSLGIREATAIIIGDSSKLGWTPLLSGPILGLSYPCKWRGCHACFSLLSECQTHEARHIYPTRCPAGPGRVILQSDFSYF